MRIIKEKTTIVYADGSTATLLEGTCVYKSIQSDGSILYHEGDRRWFALPEGSTKIYR